MAQVSVDLNNYGVDQTININIPEGMDINDEAIQNGIKEIADIPALIACSLAWSPSFLAKANPDLNVDIITLIPSAIVPYVGSKPATSKAA